MNKMKGFTLIELMVVIGIIGILASVILVSVNNAQQNGTNGAIRNGVTNLRKQTELTYANLNFTYGAGTIAKTDNCITGSLALSGAGFGTVFNKTTEPLTTNTTIMQLASINTLAGGTDVAPNIACAQSGGVWAFAVLLKKNAGTYCIDSRGINAVEKATYTTAAQAIGVTPMCN